MFRNMPVNCLYSKPHLIRKSVWKNGHEVSTLHTFDAVPLEIHCPRNCGQGTIMLLAAGLKDPKSQRCSYAYAGTD